MMWSAAFRLQNHANAEGARYILARQQVAHFCSLKAALHLVATRRLGWSAAFRLQNHGNAEGAGYILARQQVAHFCSLKAALHLAVTRRLG